jgi:hypothetical protein
MADRYEPGVVRIYYNSTGFKVGVSVTVDMLLPNSVWVKDVPLHDVGNGVYFLNWNFNVTGSYLGLFREDGKQKVIRQFEVRDQVTGTGRSRHQGYGDNLINL